MNFSKRREAAVAGVTTAVQSAAAKVTGLAVLSLIVAFVALVVALVRR